MTNPTGGVNVDKPRIIAVRFNLPAKFKDTAGTFSALVENISAVSKVSKGVGVAVVLEEKPGVNSADTTGTSGETIAEFETRGVN